MSSSHIELPRIPRNYSRREYKTRRNSWAAEPIYDRIAEYPRGGIIGATKEYQTGWLYPELKENYASPEDIARYERSAEAYTNRRYAQQERRIREREEEEERQRQIEEKKIDKSYIYKYVKDYDKNGN